MEEQDALLVKDPSLYNEDLAPVQNEKRNWNWNWFNYTTVWMGMARGQPLFLRILKMSRQRFKFFKQPLRN
jgi:cytosine/uracil/thiamine/allantoin permease